MNTISNLQKITFILMFPTNLLKLNFGLPSVLSYSKRFLTLKTNNGLIILKTILRKLSKLTTYDLNIPSNR